MQSLSAVRSEEVDLEDIKSAAKAKVPFECPRCHWIMRSEKPDDKHPIPSTVKPNESIADSDVVEQNYVCRNPKCQISFIVYWSDPRDFLNRI
jgi:rubredoxin